MRTKKDEVRQDIIDVVKTELKYQDIMKADTNRPDIVEVLSVGETITAIQHNLDKAREAWYRTSKPHTEAMGYLRKVSALCIQAGENFGMPERIIL